MVPRFRDRPPRAFRLVAPPLHAGLAACVLALWCLTGAAAGAQPLFSGGRAPSSAGVSARMPAQARLFPAGRDEASGRYRAVVEIALAEGYKTYWREPGDSGVPTTFDWAGSANVGEVRVLYPTPVRFFDGAGHAIGYTKTVRFPIEVTPAAGSGPVELRLDIDFGVCREICIPERASVAAGLADIVQIAGLWEDATALVPAESAPGAAVAGLSIESARLGGGELRLTVAGEIGEGDDVFVEGPAGWRFGRPLRETHPGGAVFTVPVRHPAFDAPVALDATLSAGGRAIETRLRLDPPG